MARKPIGAQAYMGNLGPSLRELLLARAPDINRAAAAEVPPYAEQLAGLWASLRDAPERGAAASPAVVKRIHETLEENRRKLASRGGAALMERLAHLIVEPAVAVSTGGYTWNAAFAAEFEADESMHDRVREALAPLERMLRGALPLDQAALLYPLGRRVFSLRVVSLADEGLSLAYFFPTPLEPPALPQPVRFMLCARLSGLAAKQIAPLLGVTKASVDGWSKRYRAELQRLKQQMTNSGEP